MYIRLANKSLFWSPSSENSSNKAMKMQLSSFRKVRVKSLFIHNAD